MRTITEYFPFRAIHAGAVVLAVLAASSGDLLTLTRRAWVEYPRMGGGKAEVP